jgi:hypothetical protein
MVMEGYPPLFEPSTHGIWGPGRHLMPDLTPHFDQNIFLVNRKGPALSLQRPGGSASEANMQGIHTLAFTRNPLVYAVYPYIDTIEALYPRYKLTNRGVAQLTKIGCQECETKEEWVHRYKLNFPFDEETLLELDWITEQYGGIVTRFDPALDIQTTSPIDLRTWILQHALLRWRRPNQMDDRENGTYWIPLILNPARNLLVYTGRPNKVTKETEGCVHFEQRFQRASTVRRQGIYRVKDFINLDLNEPFGRHVKYTNIADIHGERTIREALKLERERMVETKSRYHRDTLQSLTNALQRRGMDRAQMVKDRFSRRIVTEIPALFQIPSKLIWRSKDEIVPDMQFRQLDLMSLETNMMLEKGVYR